MQKNLFRLAACTFAILLSGFGIDRAAHAAAPVDPTAHWVGTWGAAPMAASNAKADLFASPTGTTLREIVHVSLGGSTVRVVFTNEFGLESLNIDAANVATPGADGAISNAVPLTFAGKPAVTIPAGALMVSDPVAIKLAPLSDLSVSFFLPAQSVSTVTCHGFADQTSYMVDGNSVSAGTLDGAKKLYSWDFLKGVDVAGGMTSGAIVTFGDSITDGAHSTRDANARWPDVLARRLQADKTTADMGVLNMGIGGNRILHDGTGPNALARFDRDVIAQAGVRYVILLESINDIGHGAQPPRAPVDAITADQLIAGMEQMIDRAHMHGIKVIGATLTPYGGAKYSREDGLKMVTAVNDFIRHSGKFDGVVDFYHLTEDPANPQKFLPAYDSGDDLHPGDAGYKAMGEAIDLKLFKK
ncbi:MAG: SGNH/GDSL hydrolase family protein [Acidobacteriota bacterium]